MEGSQSLNNKHIECVHDPRKMIIRHTMRTRAQSLSPPKRYPSPKTATRSHSISVSQPASTKSIAKENHLPEVSVSMPSAVARDTDPSQDIPEKETVLPTCIKAKVHRNIATKRREIIKLRKNLFQVQNSFLQQYAVLRELELQIGSPSSDSAQSPIGEVKVVSVTGWPAHDLLMLVRPDMEMTFTDELNGVFGPQVLQHIQGQLSTVPEEVLNIAADIMARRIELLNLLRVKLGKVDRTVISGIDWKTKLHELDQDTEKLHRMVADLVENMKTKINFVTALAKIPWLDREALTKKIERLQRDMLIAHNKLEVKKKEDEIKPAGSMSNIQTMQEELNKEKAAREALKDVVASAEGMLRVARARISNLEKVLKETRMELEGSKKKYKDLEQFYRHRENSYEARSKKLMEVSKTGEMTIEGLCRQRDALEIRVKELREQAELMEQKHEAREIEQKNQIESIQAKVSEQEKIKNCMENRIKELETRLQEVHNQYTTLREISNNLANIERTRCTEYIPHKENEPCELEIGIWKELQVTKAALSKAEEELRLSRADKDSFLTSLTKIAQVEEGGMSIENMAYELLEREKKIASLQHIIDELKENEKSMESTMTQYENQLAALRLEVRKLRNYDCYWKEVPQQELENEILDLQIQVETLSRERNSLISAAASRALMLERHEKAAELFARITRARRELTALLEGQTELEPFNEESRAETSRSLSSICVNASSTWSALHIERNRVIKLERAVLAQSVQLQKEELVRTQLERKRALLERELLRTQLFESTSNYNRSS